MNPFRIKDSSSFPMLSKNQYSRLKVKEYDGVKYSGRIRDYGRAWMFDPTPLKEIDRRDKEDRRLSK